MSGAGRGTPRISSVYGSPPIIANLPIPSDQIAEVFEFGNGQWCFHLDLTAVPNALTLTAAFQDWLDSGGNEELVIPRGGMRGLLVLVYDPAGIDSQLEVELLYRTRVPTSGRIESISIGAPTAPNPVVDQGATVPIASPIYQTQVQDPAEEFNFGLPFCVPAGCIDQVILSVREVGTVGGTLNVRDMWIENYGCG